MPSEINVCMGWDCPMARLDQYLVHAAFLYASYQQPSEESKLGWSQSRHIGRDGISILNNSARDKMNNLALNSSSTTFYKERKKERNHTRLQWQYKETNICSQVLNNRSSTFYKHGVEPDGKQNSCHHQKKQRTDRVPTRLQCNAVLLHVYSKLSMHNKKGTLSKSEANKSHTA